MLRNVFVYKIQCELSCPKSAEKFRGWRETHVITYDQAFFFFSVDSVILDPLNNRSLDG